MPQKEISRKDPRCLAVIALVTDLEACLRETSQIPASGRRPSFQDLIDEHRDKSTFSDWWGLDSARHIRNRITHKPDPGEPPLSLAEVERAKATFERALQEILPFCSPELQQEICGDILPNHETPVAPTNPPLHAPKQPPKVDPKYAFEQIGRSQPVPPQPPKTPPLREEQHLYQPQPDPPRPAIPIWYVLAGVCLLIGVFSFALLPPHVATEKSAPPIVKAAEPPAAMQSPVPPPPTSEKLSLVNRHVQNARTLLEARHYREALAESDVALRLEPRNPEAQQFKRKIQSIVSIIGNNGPPSLELDSSNVMDEPVPKTTHAMEYIRKAKECLEKRDYSRALAEAETAVRIDPENREARAVKEQIQNILEILSK